MYRLQVKDHFDAAHHLEHYQGKCCRMHGHRWDVEVVIEGKMLTNGILIDFAWVKEVMRQSIEVVDHYDLNSRLEVDDPTAEFLSKWFFDRISEAIAVRGSTGVRVSRVCIWESPDCCVKYYGVSER